MGPEPLQAGQHVAVLGQLHLRLGVGRLGPHGENVEDERRAVEYFHLQGVLYVAHLLGRKLVVEDDHAHLALVLLLVFDVLPDFLELALAHVGHGAGPAHALCEPPHGDGAGRVGQEFQLVQIFFCLGLVLSGGDESHEDGGLGLDFRDYKFLHF